MFQCSVCSFQSMYKYNVDRHEKVKHSKSNFTPHTINNNVTHQTGSDADVPMEQTAPSHSQNEMHSNLQEENIDQLHENIDQWQKAYETLKEQYQKLQQEEKVTTCNDGRPSHVSIQLYDKCCNALKDYMYHCQGLRTEKGQQLDRFCTAWEDLKWERDTFAKEIRRRDRCGEGVIHKKLAKKLRSGKYWDRIH